MGESVYVCERERERERNKKEKEESNHITGPRKQPVPSHIDGNNGECLRASVDYPDIEGAERREVDFVIYYCTTIVFPLSTISMCVCGWVGGWVCLY